MKKTAVKAADDDIQAFAQSLPRTADLKPQPSEFWNRLRIWHERVLGERARDSELVERRLKSLGKGFLQALCLWVGAPVQTGTVAALVASLQDAAATTPPPIWFQDFFLLLELVQGKSEKSIEAIAGAMLPETIVRLIHSDAFTASARRLAYAMHAYYRDPADLSLLILFEHAERAGYNNYSLAPVAETGADAQVAARRIAEGADLATLTAPIVDKALQVLGRRRSICARVVPEKDGAVLVFIYHMLREASIPEVDRTLFGDEVEIIVLRFRDRLRTVQERSNQRAGAAIASAIAAHLLKAKVKYAEDVGVTIRPALDGFLGALLKGEDQRVRLIEISLSHAPVEGSPALQLRADKSASLAVTLRALEQKQIWLLDELEDVEQIGLAFDHISGDKRRSYIFRLHFEPSQGAYLVKYSCGRLSGSVRAQFEHHLGESYRVRAVPSA